MKPAVQKLLARVLSDAAENIRTGKFALDDDEYMELFGAFTHRKMNIEKVCCYFGISRATLNRWQECGKLPQFHKDSGGKKYLCQDEIDDSIARWNAAHHIA